jgi:hypothetical protein
MPLSRRHPLVFVLAAAVLPLVLASCQSFQTPAEPGDTPPKKISAAEACALQEMAAHSAYIDVFTSSPFDSTGANLAAQSRSSIANAELLTCQASH